MRRSPSIWTDAPPTGTGVQLTKVRPEGRLPWNAWYGGRIVMFCPSAGWAFAAVRNVKSWKAIRYVQERQSEAEKA